MTVGFNKSLESLNGDFFILLFYNLFYFIISQAFFRFVFFIEGNLERILNQTFNPISERNAILFSLFPSWIFSYQLIYFLGYFFFTFR